MDRLVPVHNLGPNSRETSPHEVLVFDTETLIIPGTDPVIQRLEYWSLKITRRHDKNPSRPREYWARGKTAVELAQTIDSLVKTNPTMWVFAHNLSFDLAVTRLPLVLMDLGWRLGAHALATDSPWAFMARGGKSIRIADSHSILPHPVAMIAAKMGHVKPALPAQDAPTVEWMARCDADVDIVSDALTQAMDWWDEHKLGCWSTTGPQTGWNMMRHLTVKRRGGPTIWQRGPAGKPYTQSGDGHVVIDPDPDARGFERETLYQGRREAWRVGALPRGHYAEIDYQTAHLSIAADLPLPCRRGKPFERLDVDSPWLAGDHIGVVADALIDTDTPRYPYRAPGGICYPVGRFATRLAGPELVQARERGELLGVGPGYHYALSYHMQPWALWLRHALDQDDVYTPPAARMMLKCFTTRVFGKWATRTGRLDYEGVSNLPGWHAIHGFDSRSFAPTTTLHINGIMQEWVRDLDGDDSFPAVLSWVQAYTRVGLGQMIDVLGQDALVTASTDSITVDLTRTGHTGFGVAGPHVADAVAAVAADRLAAHLTEYCFPFKPRVKALVHTMEVITAQHLRIGADRRLSGIPKGAQEIATHEYSFRTWPKLGAQIAHGDPRGFVQPQRTVSLATAAGNRWQATDGCTQPPQATWSPTTGTTLHKPHTTGCATHDAPWSPHQGHALP